MNLVVLGRPGAGKGTQVARLADALGLHVVTASDALRAGDPAVQALMAAGALVPDELVVPALAAAVAVADGPVVLDGFPRTVAQCARLDEVLAGRELHAAVLLDVPAAEVVDRVRQRHAAAHRPDDDPDVVLRRLWTYELQTRPVIDWFARTGRLVTVDGTGPVDVVTARVLEALSEPPPAGPPPAPGTAPAAPAWT